LQQLLDARSSSEAGPNRLGARPPGCRTSRDVPPAHWWPAWSASLRLTCSVTMGNIHDLVTALVSDNIDVLLCHHSALQPVPSNRSSTGCTSETSRPYVSRDLQQRERFVLLGRRVGRCRLMALGRRLLRPPGRPRRRDCRRAARRQAGPQRHGRRTRHGPAVSALPGARPHRRRRARHERCRWAPAVDVPLADVAFKARANDRRAAMALWSALDRPRAG
jgi:hypothetical protein